MVNKNIQVTKRNGKIVPFDGAKISAAIGKAFAACEQKDDKNVGEFIARSIERLAEDSNYNGRLNIEQIQDLVEARLMDFAPHNVAKRYILYRDRRDKDRQSFNKLAQTFHDVVEIEDNNVKKSNANINGNTPAGQMMIFAAESSKEHASTFIVNPKYIQAYKNGYLHIHDLDYYSTKAANCNQIDLVELFNHDYIYTTDSVMRKPKRIATFAALAAIVLQSEQNEMFGG